MERVALDAETFADVIPPAWEALESRAEVKSGGTAEDFLARLRHKSEYAATAGTASRLAARGRIRVPPACICNSTAP